MKKILFTLIFVLLISSVSALTLEEVKLGGDNQERAKTATTSATLVNDGDSTVSGLSVTFSGVESEFEIDGLLGDTSLGPGESTSLTIDAFVPLDLDAVDSRGRPFVHNIGTVTVNSGDDSITSTVYMQAESNLEFGSVKLQIDGSTKTVRDGKDFENVKRGDDLELSIEVENTFNDNGDCDDDGQDCDIDDVEVIIESNGDLDLDEDLGYSSLRAKDEDTETFSFDIEDDVDDDNYDIEMYVTGFDENNARHGEYWEFTIEVDVPRDDVVIKRYELEPDKLLCGERRTTLTVTIENIGRNDQDRVSIFLDSSKLDLKQSTYNIDLEEGDETTRIFDITVPSDMSSGNYFIQIIANVDNNKETDIETATLTIRDCSDEPVDDDEPIDDDDDDKDGVNIIEVPPTAGVIVGTKKTTDFFDSNAYLLLLGVMFLIALLLVMILLVVLVKK